MQGSSNGVWVNRTQIKKPNHHLLKDGDIVEIGLNRQSNSPGVYRYRFYTQAHIKRKAVDGGGDPNVDSPVHSKVPAVGIKPDATLSAEQLRQKMTEQVCLVAGYVLFFLLKLRHCYCSILY